jgi:PII-like signaling protein
MTLEGRSTRLSVFVGEADHYGRKPLYTEIVHRAHAAGLAGATVIRGTEGYGASNHIHSSRILSLSQDLPVLVLIVDSAEKIDSFLPQLDELITEGLVVRDEVEVVKYVGRKRP